MGLKKKHVADRGLTWQDAVAEALCFGWIDSVAQRIDEHCVRQRWTPRKLSSNWSTVNLATVERLVAEGRMQPAGLAAYQARRQDRQGIYAYEQANVGQLPDEFAAQLAAVPVAQAFWDSAPASYRKLCIHWICSAKQQPTRIRRMARLVEDCAHGVLVKSQRYGDEPGWAAKARARLGLPDPG